MLVLFDEHWKAPKPEFLVSCTPGASLPIDVHVGADDPNEETSGTAFAHFATSAFPSGPAQQGKVERLSCIGRLLTGR